MLIMQKNLFPLQIGQPLANASKIYRIYVQIQYFIPNIDKEGGILSPHIGKLDIYCRKD